jgi:hypothetical protein
MATWAHAEIELDHDGNIEISFYGDPSELDLGEEGTFADVISEMGGAGWELIQFHNSGPATTYWFKKQIS